MQCTIFLLVGSACVGQRIQSPSPAYYQVSEACAERRCSERKAYFCQIHEAYLKTPHVRYCEFRCIHDQQQQEARVLKLYGVQAWNQVIKRISTKVASSRKALLVELLVAFNPAVAFGTSSPPAVFRTGMSGLAVLVGRQRLGRHGPTMGPEDGDEDAKMEAARLSLQKLFEECSVDPEADVAECEAQAKEAAQKAAEEARLKAAAEAAAREASLKRFREASRKALDASLKALEETKRKAAEEARLKAAADAAEREAELKAKVAAEEAAQKAAEEARLKASKDAAEREAEMKAEAETEKEVDAAQLESLFDAQAKAEAEESARKAAWEAWLKAAQADAAEREAELKVEEEAEKEKAEMKLEPLDSVPTKAKPDREKLLEEAKDLLDYESRVKGAEHETTLRAQADYADLLGEMGHHAEAEPLKKKLLFKMTRLHGQGRMETLHVMSSLAKTIAALGRNEEANALKEDVRRQTLRFLRPGSHMCDVMDKEGKHAEAEPKRRELLGFARRAVGPEHPLSLSEATKYADTLSELGRNKEAEPIRREVVQLSHAFLGPDHPDTLKAAATYADKHPGAALDW